MPVTVRLTGDMSTESTSPTVDDIAAPLRLYGPGDVIGFDAREIVRTEPQHLTMNFPPHLFPFVEFDRPDFPWLFTPAAPDAEDCLRPWLVLAVVRTQVARITADPRRPLPMLECPRTELPDLDESWAWVHAQYVGSATSRAELPGALASRPQQTVSRFIGSRKLEPARGGVAARYYACLVPAFEAGRKAGLGEPLTGADETLQPAWNLTDTGPVTLPVYYHWEFGTGEGGDFEDLVDRLQLLRSLPGAPTKRMDVSRPGFGMQYTDATLAIEGVLRLPGDPSPDAPTQLPPTFQDTLRQILEAPETAAAGTPPRLTPPVYGRWAAGTASLAVGAAPAWLRDLNLDPRYRVAAAVGTQVVQRYQDQLVTASWEQVAEIQAVNQYLRQKQLGRAVTASFCDKRLARLSPDAFYQVTAPVTAAAGGRELPKPERPGGGGTSPTAADQLFQAVLSAPYRRIARSLNLPTVPAAGMSIAAPGGEPSSAATAPLTGPGFLERIGAGLLQAVPPPGVTPGATAVAGDLLGSPIAPTSRVPVAAATASTVSTGEEYKATLLGLLDPLTNFADGARARVDVPRGMESIWGRPDALEPVSFTPSFPQPMYEPLQELFADMLAPGLERIPNDSVTVLEGNARFIEAYMVGLNHELSRELLWREYPTDLRGTYFRQFWDVRGSRPAATTPAEREALFDVPPIADWRGALGNNLPADRGRGLFMLLIRGDLLLRYPTTLVYALRARWSKNATNTDVAPAVVDTSAQPEFPVMRISPAPGVTLLGFNLPSSPRGTAMAPPGNPGWFFVLEEQPTEIRFGLDISSQALTSWRELSWEHVKLRPDGSDHVSVRTSAPTPVPADPNASWGRNGAHMAYITRQQPYRLQVHSSRWFPPPQYGYPLSLANGIGGNLL